MLKEKEGEGGGIDGNLHLFLPVNRDKIELSLARESQRARLASGQWLRGSVGVNYNIPRFYQILGEIFAFVCLR
jgi:hypothetical protein